MKVFRGVGFIGVLELFVSQSGEFELLVGSREKDLIWKTMYSDVIESQNPISLAKLKNSEENS